MGLWRLAQENEQTKQALGIKTIDDFKSWLDDNCYFFGTLQSLANGSKHFDRRSIARSEVAEVMGSADESPPAKHSFLSVEVERDGEVFWQDFGVVMDITMMFGATLWARTAHTMTSSWRSNCVS